MTTDSAVLSVFEYAYKLGREVARGAPNVGPDAPGAPPEAIDTVIDLQRQLADLEHKLIQRAYLECKGNKTAVARLLGIKTSALYYKLTKYGIGTIAKRKKDLP